MLGGGALGGVGGLALGGTLAARAPAAERVRPESPVPAPGRPRAAAPVDWAGATQAGVDRPWTPQRSCLLEVFDWPVERPVEQLAALGRRIADLVSGASEGDRTLLPDGAGDLTVTVGLGPALVRRYGESLPGADPLPSFAGDAGIDPEHHGGDLMILLAADDPGALAPVSEVLRAMLPEATLRWAQRGFRARSEGPIARNPLGFHDGVIVPRGQQELDENVWFGPRDERATICAIRRFVLDTAGFSTMPMQQREQVVGRDVHGVPLSGGEPFSEAKLNAKRPDGDFEVPLRSHLRAAHPSFTGSDLMLRRSYAYDNGAGDAGLLFISYQRELRTFVETLRRIEEVGDEMMRFARATASASFLVLPGMTAGRPLGARLHDAGRTRGTRDGTDEQEEAA
nr:Dyp-type peroxidase [Leucobacter chromiireducens]